VLAKIHADKIDQIGSKSTGLKAKENGSSKTGHVTLQRVPGHIGA
jgi:hypothetical protein